MISRTFRLAMNLLLKKHNARLVISLLYSELTLLERSLRELEKRFGPVDMETDEIEHNHVQAFVEEMGEGLRRKIFSFRRDTNPADLAEIKEGAIRIEEKLGEKVSDLIFRKVNIDPMIVSASGVTMANSHDAPHRICIGSHVYAEKLLALVNDHFEAFPWTYPDFMGKEALTLFRQVAQELERSPLEFAERA